METFLKRIKRDFIPHGENHYEPHFLRHESMFIFFLLIIVIELGFLIQVYVVFDKTNFLASVLPGVLTTITNEERAQNNAGPLVENNLLDQAAKLKAEDMASKGYFAHTSPEGKTPWYWFDQVGYKYSSAGENLAVNFFESQDVAQAWMNSPTHRENIVKPIYTEIGIGVASGVYKGIETVFVAQLFGTPLKVSNPTPITSKTNQTSVTTPTTVKPKPTTAQTTPKTTPPTVVATTPVTPKITPSATQVLGEEALTPTKRINISPIIISIEKILASPRQSVAYAYGMIALVTLFSLLMVFFVASEIRHPLIMLRGLGLVSVIILLLFVNIKVIPLETDVGTGDITASAINAIAY